MSASLYLLVRADLTVFVLSTMCMSPTLFVFGPEYGTVIHDPWAWLCASSPATLYLGIVYYVNSSFFLLASVHDRLHVYGLLCPYLAMSGPGYGAQTLGIELCTLPPGFLCLAVCTACRLSVPGSVHVSHFLCAWVCAWLRCLSAWPSVCSRT